MMNTVEAIGITSDNSANIGSNEFNLNAQVDSFPSGLPGEIKQRIIDRSLTGMNEEQKIQLLKSRVQFKPERSDQQKRTKSFFSISKALMNGTINENFIGHPLSNQNTAGMQDVLRQQYSNKNIKMQNAYPGIKSSSIGFSGNVSILWEKHTFYNDTYAYAVEDLDGDGKPDIIVQSWGSSGTTETASITALRGYDGYQLWTKTFSGTYVWISGDSYGDLSGDGKADVIVQTWISSGTTETASAFGLRGYDGYQLWTKSVSGDPDYTYLYASTDQDFTGDNLPDVIVQAQSKTGTTETYSITGLRSYDGYQLWTKSVSGDEGYNYLYASTYQDFTGDNLSDVIIEAQSKSGTVYTASVTGFQGNNDVALWSKSITGTNMWISGYSAGDLNGDGKPDVLIGMYLENGGSPVTATTYALRGYDGYELWSRSVSGTGVSIYGNYADDLNGDGKPEVLISTFIENGGSPVTATAYAVRGYDGYELWSKSVSGTSIGIFGYSAGDLNGDGKPEVLMGMALENGGSPVTAMAYALRGYDGFQLWSTSVSGTSLWISGDSYGDLTGDGKPDVIIQSDSYSSSTQSSSIAGLRGYDGYQLWTHSASADQVYISLYYSNYQDLTGDNLSDVIFQTESVSGSTQTASVTGLRGYDGYQLWTRSASGDPGYTNQYLSVYQDFTGDNLPDVVVQEESTTGITEIYSITGLRSYDGYQLWTKSVSGDQGYTYLYASTDQDLTGDRLPDVIVETESESGNIQTASVTGLRGYDGSQLWSKLVSGEYAYAWYSSIFDWEGDGQPDVLILRSNESYGSPDWIVNSDTDVIRGNDGASLWNSQSNSYINAGYWVADLNGNGKADVLLSSGDTVYALTEGTAPAAPSVTIDPASTTGLSPGSTFPVKVSVNPNGKGISSGEIRLSFNTSVLEVTSLNKGDLLGSNAIDPGSIYNNSEGTIKTIYARVGATVPPTPSGTWSTVVFKVKSGASPGTTNISITSVSLADENFAELTGIIIANGTATVSGGLTGDINGDNIVNYKDLGLLGASYGLSLGDTGYNAKADLNNDGIVNYKDLGILGAHYGEQS